MNVFISFSGDRSKAVALELRGWLRKVLQGLGVFMSDRDIAAGTTWTTELFRQLKDSNFGILCVTPENADASWLLFEAGAVWRGVEGQRVVPYCFDLEPTTLEDPLRQFQARADDRKGTYDLVASINAVREKPLSKEELDEAFDMWWPKLESALKNIGATQRRPIRTAGGFCDHVAGVWWQQISPSTASAISFVQMRAIPDNNTLTLSGTAFDSTRQPSATWRSRGVCVDCDRLQIFYYWQGEHFRDPSVSFGGFGEISFYETPGEIRRGKGFYSNTNLADFSESERKLVRLRRATEEEAEIVLSGSTRQQSELIAQVLDHTF